MNMKAVYEAYQGEDIDITLEGKSDYNLDLITFTVIVYPCSDPTDTYMINKSQCTKEYANCYTATVPKSVSSKMRTGPYIIEVYDSTNSKIYQCRGRMIINTSAAKAL